MECRRRKIKRNEIDSGCSQGCCSSGRGRDPRYKVRCVGEFPCMGEVLSCARDFPGGSVSSSLTVPMCLLALLANSSSFMPLATSRLPCRKRMGSTGRQEGGRQSQAGIRTGDSGMQMGFSCTNLSRQPIVNSSSICGSCKGSFRRSKKSGMPLRCKWLLSFPWVFY